MIPKHVQISECGKEGFTVVDGKDSFSITAGALKGNGWDAPDFPDGVKSPVILHIIGKANGGLILRDPELGCEYWVSSTALRQAGCIPSVTSP